MVATVADIVKIMNRFAPPQQLVKIFSEARITAAIKACNIEKDPFSIR